MAESSLSLGFADYRKRIGTHLGYGPTSGNWTTAQSDEITDILNSGVRQFYYPPPIQGLAYHEWTFLKPTDTVPTVADTANYTMEDDFGGIDGSLTFATADNGWKEIEIIGEGRIRVLQQNNPVSTGRPQYACIRPVATDGASGQRWQMTLWPTPDAVYTLTLVKDVLPSALSALNPYPYGGMAHSETILESCLAIAEQRYDDEEGIHARLFTKQLAASIERDRRANAIEFFGYNGDRSDGMPRQSFDRYTNVTYNGVQY